MARVNEVRPRAHDQVPDEGVARRSMGPTFAGRLARDASLRAIHERVVGDERPFRRHLHFAVKAAGLEDDAATERVDDEVVDDGVPLAHDPQARGAVDHHVALEPGLIGAANREGRAGAMGREVVANEVSAGLVGDGLAIAPGVVEQVALDRAAGCLGSARAALVLAKLDVLLTVDPVPDHVPEDVAVETVVRPDLAVGPDPLGEAHRFAPEPEAVIDAIAVAVHVDLADVAEGGRRVAAPEELALGHAVVAAAGNVYGCSRPAVLEAEAPQDDVVALEADHRVPPEGHAAGDVGADGNRLLGGAADGDLDPPVRVDVRVHHELIARHELGGACRELLGRRDGPGISRQRRFDNVQHFAGHQLHVMLARSHLEGVEVVGGPVEVDRLPVQLDADNAGIRDHQPGLGRPNARVCVGVVDLDVSGRQERRIEGCRDDVAERRVDLGVGTGREA